VALTVPAMRAARHWNTSDPVHPAEFVHHPSGTHVAITAYSDALGRFTRLPPGHGNGVLLGPRTIGSEHIALTFEHGGTEIAVTANGTDDDALRIEWRTLKHGEWGLRFWLNICVWNEDGTERHYDPDSTELHGPAGPGQVVVKGPRFPLMATFHDDMDALAREYDEQGYFYLASRGTRGRLGVLRYNLEEMAAFEVAAAWGADRPAAAAAADRALEGGGIAELTPAHTGHLAGALDAVRDCVGWCTVWDRHNDRPYTQQSRNWVAPKFGGWGVWLNDSVYHGHLASLVDTEVAHENQRAVFAGATPWGNLPCLLTGNDAWVDRTQPPIMGWITWMHYLRSGDRRFLEDAWTPLANNHAWWWRERDGNGNGLVEYGTSPVGDGLYRGTKLAAKDESMMDNSPVHDEARLVAETNTLDCEDIGLNSFLALDGEMLALIAAERGEDGEAARLATSAEAHKARIREQLWDETRSVFANRLWSGAFTDSLAPTSFYPLLCGAATEAQAEAVVQRHLLDDTRFWGPWPVPACSRSDPAFQENVYWRGRVWPPLNMAVYAGLRRYGFDEAATALARRCHDLFMLNWADERICGENFSAATGRADDQPDTDLFYTWGALMAAIAVAEISDVTPWQGWTLTNAGEDLHLSGLCTPAGPADIMVRGGTLSVAVAGRTLLETNARGRMSHAVLSGGVRRLVVPPQSDGEVFVAFPDLGPRALADATLDGAPLSPAAGDTLRFAVPASGGDLRITLPG